MRRLRRLMGAGLLLCTTMGPAFAGPTFDWDPAYMWEAGGTPTDSPVGSELHIVGLITSFDVPFQDLNANDPTTEYTFYCEGLLSDGTTTYGTPSTTFYRTTYTGGTIAIYAGSPRNSNFDPNPPNATVPANYIDGTAILTGVFSGFYTETNNFTTFQTGNAEGTITWTGGTMFERVLMVGGQPCPGLFTGGLTWNPAMLIPGYLFRHAGKADHNCPTGSPPTTWGRLKTLYR